MDKIKNTNKHYYLAKAYSIAEMYNKAVDEFDKALKFSPEFAHIHYDLAKIYEKMKLFGNAAKEYKIALDINPHYADAKEALAKLLEGDRDKKLKIKQRLPTKKILKITLLVFCSALVYLTVLYFAKPVPQNIAYFSIPALHPSGITILDTEVWISDWFSQTVYKHKLDVTLSLVKSTKLPDIHPSSIAADKNGIWLCDAFSKKIFQLDKNTLKIIGSFASPASNPSAIFSADKYLWSCDSNEDKIYKHKKDKNLTVELSIPVANPNPIGIFIKGKNVFVADCDTDKVYRYFLDEKQKKLSKICEYEIPAFGSKVSSSRKISGLSITANYVFLTSEGTGEAYRIPFKMLKGK
ncbi:MAG: tetratricopeptide repeat protein [Elusimicrobiota bacterium]